LKADVKFRRAESADIPAILRLQAAYFVANLTDEEKREGFLSAEFTPQQAADMAADLGTTIATIGSTVAGFVCAFRREFDTGSPVLEKMLTLYDSFQFRGQPLSRCNSYIYGPVCIAREFRGRGLLRGLYETQKKDLAGRFEVGVAFVARSNPHSLDAHIQGLGMDEAGEFEVNNNRYVVLAFPLP
jgi:hypothetical protein